MAARFYPRLSGTAAITPSPDAAWTNTGAIVRKPMHVSLDVNDALTTSTRTAPTAGQVQIYLQLHSRPMAAGNVFDTSVTYKAYFQVLESAVNDNLFARCGIRILSEDGSTVRHTIKSVADYSASLAEFNTALRNKAFLDGDAGTGSYTTVDGDRLVFELGAADAGGASIQGSVRVGSAGSTDLGENETSTSTTERPWFECSLDIVFKTPTTVQRFVDAASVGGDGTTTSTTGANAAYASLNAALAALQSTDYATPNNLLLVTCIGTNVDTVAVSMSTTLSGKFDPDCKLRIITNQPNVQQYSTSAYRIEISGVASSVLSANGGDYVELVLLHSKHTIGAGAGGVASINIADRVAAANAHFVMDRCRSWGVVDNGRTSVCGGPRVAWLGSKKVSIINCLTVGWKATGATHNGFTLDPATADVVIYNSDAIDCGNGITGAASVVAKNCGATGCTDGYNGTFSGSSDRNASSLAADAPGTNARNSVTPTFVDAAGGDYHLSTADTAWQDQAGDLSTDARYPFGTDGDGDTRLGTWDIGADQAVDVIHPLLSALQAVSRAANW